MESIVVGYDYCLLVGDFVEFVQCCLLVVQLCGELCEVFVDLWVGWYQGFVQIVEVYFGVIVEQGCEQGDVDGVFEVVQDVEQV